MSGLETVRPHKFSTPSETSFNWVDDAANDAEWDRDGCSTHKSVRTEYSYCQYNYEYSFIRAPVLSYRQPYLYLTYVNFGFDILAYLS